VTIREFHREQLDLGALIAAKGDRRVSVCLPARDEEATVAAIVRSLLGPPVEAGRRHGPPVDAGRGHRALVDEVLVVDDGSRDQTAVAAAEAGARVVPAADVLPDVAGEGHGKGEALWKGLASTTGELVVFLDADIRDFDARFVTGLLAPLLLHDELRFVKAFYERTLDGRPRGGGRVTELVARPLITLLFPQLASVVQPLAGECAGRRDTLEQLPFVRGYGVDLGLLIDVCTRFGPEAIAQVDLGQRVHRNRSLAELAPMAAVVLETGLRRAGVEMRDDELPFLARPGARPVALTWGELPPLASVTT